MCHSFVRHTAVRWRSHITTTLFHAIDTSYRRNSVLATVERDRTLQLVFHAIDTSYRRNSVLAYRRNTVLVEIVSSSLVQVNVSFTLASEECGNLSREVLGKVSKLL